MVGADAWIAVGSGPILDFESLRSMLLRVLSLALVFSRWFVTVYCPVQHQDTVLGVCMGGLTVHVKRS